MKEQEVHMLDNEDQMAVDLLVRLGMSTHVAKTLLYVSQVDECQFIDIEKGANLRQPQVSLAMQELRRKGWVTKKDVRNKGKGRPIHIYTSNVEICDVLDDFECKKKEEFETIQGDITSLKEVLITR